MRTLSGAAIVAIYWLSSSFQRGRYNYCKNLTETVLHIVVGKPLLNEGFKVRSDPYTPHWPRHPTRAYIVKFARHFKSIDLCTVATCTVVQELFILIGTFSMISLE